MEEGEPTLAPGQVVADRYVVRRVIGVGGMGAVYEVQHQVTKRIGALKLLHPQYAKIPSIVERFVREASAASHIGSSHIIETHDAGTSAAKEPYIFMELLRGRALDAYIEEQGRLSVPFATGLICQACRGLGAAHDAGIIHRDVKPENLFVVDGPRPFVKILDFGISKFDPELTQANSMTVEGQAMGTPFYMPPEQVHGYTDIDGRADIYSLAVSLYHCVTGKPPFDAPNIAAMSVKIHQGQYAPMRTLVPEIPEAFAAVVSRAMARDRNARFATMKDFEKALRPFAEDEANSSMLPVTPPRTAPGVSPTAGTVVVQGGAATTGGAVSGKSDAGTFAPLTESQPWLKSRVSVPLAVAGVVVIGGAGVWLTRGSTDSGTTPSAEPSAVAEVPVTSDVRVQVRGAPAGAVIRFAGKSVSDTFRVPRATQAASLAVEAPGFQPWTHEVVPDADQVVAVRMLPAVAPPASSEPAASATPPEPAAVAKPKPIPKKATEKKQPEALHKGRLGSEFTPKFE